VVRFPGALLDQALAVAHDVAQLALRRWRHEAPAQQAELKELGEPLAVAHVRLAARHHLHMLRIDQGELEAPLQELVDGPPVDPGRLHRDVGAAGGGEPVGQPQQLAGGGAERAYLLAARRPVARRPEAGGDAGLVHVEPTADGVEHFHRTPRFLRRAVRCSPQRRSYACCPSGGTQQSGVPGSAWVPIDDGLSGTSLQPTSTPALHGVPATTGRIFG